MTNSPRRVLRSPRTWIIAVCTIALIVGAILLQRNMPLSPLAASSTPKVTTSKGPAGGTAPPQPGTAVQYQGMTLALGSETASITQALGTPGRKLPIANLTWYVYNSDYAALLFVGIIDGKAEAFYSCATGFSYEGLSIGGAQTAYQAREGISVQIYFDSFDHAVGGLLIHSQHIPHFNGTAESQALLLYDLVNAERAKRGHSVLVWSPGAAEAAREHCEDMRTRNYQGHFSPEGRTPEDRMRAEGLEFEYGTENLAFGATSAIDAHHALMNSQAHRDNLLSIPLTHLGVGINSVCVYYAECFFKEN